MNALRKTASRSIHPQGWVPIETGRTAEEYALALLGSIHPQGWVPIETMGNLAFGYPIQLVAFTPKGGCPLKRAPALFIHKDRVGK